MLQIDHRESFDVDIFVDDPQVLPFLNPWMQGYTLPIWPDGYQSDGTRALKIVFEKIGEIDFICAAGLTVSPMQLAKVRGHNVLLETPAEIIAKKIYYRGSSMQPRDMFDIACVMKVLGGEYVVNALSPFKEECRRALSVARRMDPQFAKTVMMSLLYRERFSDIPKQAQAMATELLEAVCASSDGVTDPRDNSPDEKA
ncbi:nucleotidyl transferase AbiEii/AbiGii toxin family protein [Ciceribacter lividus]